MSSSGIEKRAAELGAPSIQASEDAPAELTAVVDELLNSLSKFSSVHADIFAKMDDMSRRLDSLESTLQVKSTSTSLQ